jgi:hypothetical protein
MYNAHELLTRIDAHKWPILIVCAFAMIGNYIFFIEAFRVARRDKIVTIPIFCTMFWFAHDLSFVYRAGDWFSSGPANPAHSWYTELFWGALVLTVTFETIYLIQVLQYGRTELLPDATQRQFTLLVLAGVVGAVVCWEAVKYTLHDPLYAGSFGIANLSYPLMGVAMAVRRRSMRGQTPIIWMGYLLLVVCWASANTIWYGPPFRSVQWIALDVSCLIGGLGLLYASIRWPGTEAAPTSMPAPETWQPEPLIHS